MENATQDNQKKDGKIICIEQAISLLKSRRNRKRRKTQDKRTTGQISTASVTSIVGKNKAGYPAVKITKEKIDKNTPGLEERQTKKSRRNYNRKNQHPQMAKII